ncbi:nucleotide-diphospho-sugar transferase [Zopfochytrium polystomum]|nr:nucleotide-diphospho-sugar transferase [Zopfochytrium polystomum]
MSRSMKMSWLPLRMKPLPSAGQLRRVSEDKGVMVQKPVGTHPIRDYLRENKDNKNFLKANEDPARNPNRVKMSDHIAQSVKDQQIKTGYSHNDLNFGNNMEAKQKDARRAQGGAAKLRDEKLSDFDNRFMDRTAKSLCNEVGLAFRSTAGSRLFRRAGCSRGGGKTEAGGKTKDAAAAGGGKGAAATGTGKGTTAAGGGAGGGTAAKAGGKTPGADGGGAAAKAGTGAGGGKAAASGKTPATATARGGGGAGSGAGGGGGKGAGGGKTATNGAIGGGGGSAAKAGAGTGAGKAAAGGKTPAAATARGGGKGAGRQRRRRKDPSNTVTRRAREFFSSSVVAEFLRFSSVDSPQAASRKPPDFPRLKKPLTARPIGCETSSYVTLITSNSYLPGAVTLAHTIRTASAAAAESTGSPIHPIVVLADTTALSKPTLSALSRAFDRVIPVPVVRSGRGPNDARNLQLLGRPELDVTLTKLNAWNPSVLGSGVRAFAFIDADAFVLGHAADPARLFSFLRDDADFAAAPDAGWPDAFNSGVFVARPDAEVFEALRWHAEHLGSFDGGDQGLLNDFFVGWAAGVGVPVVPAVEVPAGAPPRPEHRPLRAVRLPFVFNVTPSAVYSYLPAYFRYRNDIAIIHFAGTIKPWRLQRFSNGTVKHPSLPSETAQLHNAWWAAYEEYLSKEAETTHKDLPRSDRGSSSAPVSRGQNPSHGVSGNRAELGKKPSFLLRWFQRPRR